MTNTTIQWDLSELHHTTDVAETQPLLDQLHQSVRAFSDQYKGTVGTLSPDAFFEAITAYEAIQSSIMMVSQFAHLHYAVKMSDPTVLKFVTKLDEFTSLMSNDRLFFFLEIGQVAPSVVDHWMTLEANRPYEYTVRRAVARNQYRLSESEEQWINIKDINGCDALRKLYAEHTSQYVFRMTVDGEERVMNGSECRALRYHADPVVRSDAMALFLGQYKADQHIMVHLFNSIIKDVNLECKKRGYARAMDAMNIHNDLSNDLVDVLHNITTESNGLVQQYYTLKKDIIGQSRMTLSDIYAPIPTTSTDAISWDEATGIVLDSFAQFDSEFFEFAKDMITGRRIDVFPAPSKRGGAFCSSSTPGVRPYVMLNFLGKQRDVATLAHELGHAIHSYFSSKQSPLNYHAVLPVCETASVFCEMLVLDALKKKTTVASQKIALLSAQLEDIFATSHRQNMFSRFEQVIHEKIGHQRLSGDELSALYANELRIMFGDSVDIPSVYHWEWAAIPHMLDVPFYVYSYNFGNLLVFGLYQMYLDDGVAMIPKLKRILAGGSSMGPVQLFANEGINILEPSFWQRSVQLIESVYDELASLVRSNAPSHS